MVKKVDPLWHKEQVEKYIKIQPSYEILAKLVQAILESIARDVDPLALVQARAKSVASFAEKAIRKVDKYSDPVNELTDLCGGRVVTHTQSQVERVSQTIKSRIRDIEDENVGTRLKTGEFGYLSYHYVVQLKAGFDYGKRAKAILRKKSSIKALKEYKAEIQVRTLLQHAWADTCHDRLFKNEFKVPEKWDRISLRMAAVLEDADQALERLSNGVDSYRSYFGAYMSKEEITREIELLTTILKSVPKNQEIALRQAKLAHVNMDWDTIIETLEDGTNPNKKLMVNQNHELLRELGNALCIKYSQDTQCTEFKRGQAYLSEAIRLEPNDADTIALYAATWEPRDKDTRKVLKEKKGRARENYLKANKLQPDNPYHLSSFLEFEIEENQGLETNLLIERTLNRAIERCREHVAGGVEFPRAHFTIGRLSLLLDNAFQSLDAYAKAIRTCVVEKGNLPVEIISREIEAITRMKPAGKRMEIFEWARWLLVIAKAVLSKNLDILRVELQVEADTKVRAPVVIIAGGCDKSIEIKLKREYGSTLREAFKDFKGSIIGGGTKEGVSGIAGSIKQKYPRQDIDLIGFIPSLLPAMRLKTNDIIGS